MDSIWVSEAYDPGSIPGRATRSRNFPLIPSVSKGFLFFRCNIEVTYELINQTLVGRLQTWDKVLIKKASGNIQEAFSDYLFNINFRYSISFLELILTK